VFAFIADPKHRSRHRNYDVEMGHSQFQMRFRSLVEAFYRYHDAPRTTQDVRELGAARWELEIARRDMAIERERLVAARHSTQRGIPCRTSISGPDRARLRVEGYGIVS
jgi:hypothetical protein